MTDAQPATIREWLPDDDLPVEAAAAAFRTAHARVLASEAASKRASDTLSAIRREVDHSRQLLDQAERQLRHSAKLHPISEEEPG